MPLKTLVLLLAGVILAAAITIWIARLVGNTLPASGGTLVAAIPVLLVGLVLWRLLSQRQK